jgi:two-component system response regulator AtoC
MSTVCEQSFQINAEELPDESILFGGTAAMRGLLDKINRVRQTDLSILLRGESGTGKEIVARYVHTHSSRSDGPFVKVNCAAIPAGLLESELLGYEKGAFSGADEVRLGLVERADEGTLFLDEIGDMDWTLQTKLLRLLQDGRYTRIGGREERRARLRIICATNVDLEFAAGARSFRQDLLYRIDVISLHLVPLRERKQDIAQLCAYFLEKLSKKFGKSAPPITPETMRLLERWNWPGNLRELENWVMRFIVLGGEESLEAELAARLESAPAAENAKPLSGPLTGHLKHASREAASAAAQAVILRVLRANDWNRQKTAKELNMSYRSLLYKLREAGVPQRRKAHAALLPQERV